MSQTTYFDTDVKQSSFGDIDRSLYMFELLEVTENTEDRVGQIQRFERQPRVSIMLENKSYCQHEAILSLKLGSFICHMKKKEGGMENEK